MNPLAKAIPEDRNSHIDAFLARSGWGGARREAIPGDASFRRYERISHDGKTAILMDAPPEKEDVRPFVAVARYLTGVNLRAPKVLAQDEANGFLLLEDLGNDLFSRVLTAAKSTDKEKLEQKLYLEATDVLSRLYYQARGGNMPGIPPYDNALLERELALLTEWYMPAIAGTEAAAKSQLPFRNAWENVLKSLPDLPVVATLRDFHADNLLVLPGLSGSDAVGLLDFQDAVIGSPAYDVVSFLEDARRDVSESTVKSCKGLFLQNTKLSADAFETAYAILGAQRNIKIIGIFTRLGVRDGKFRYQHYLPRVWGHLKHDLRHPALAPVANWVNEHIPTSWHSGAAPFPDKL